MSEYSNLCILAEIVMVHSGSNSSVERAFSMLTAMLNDRRLKMKHSTIESLMIVKINDKIWSAEERAEIIQRAVDIHLDSSRRRKIVDESPVKRRRMEEIVLSSDDESSSNEYEESSSDDDNLQ